MTLAEALSPHLYKNKRLKGVPKPVIDEVVKQAIKAMDKRLVHGAIPRDHIDSEDWVHCESCELIGPRNFMHHLASEDGDSYDHCPLCYQQMQEQKEAAGS